MRRRAFFGFMGGAAVAGPAAVKSAAEMGLGDLSVSVGNFGNSVAGSSIAGADPADSKTCAQRGLSRLLGKSAVQIAREKRDTYVHAFDADVAALRSVTIGNKIRLQKRLNYDRNREREEENYRGILAGLWD